MDEALIVTRAAHYVSLIQLSGIFVFLSLVAEPVLRRDGKGIPAVATIFRARLMIYAWASLVVALASGFVWLLLQAVEMSGRSWVEVLSGGILGTVLSHTQFGRVWELRLAVAILLVAYLLFGNLRRRRRPTASAPIAPLILSNTLLATLAWAGHASDTAGRAGAVHLSADVIHLLAAGAWLGSLVPLALLFAHTRRVDGSALIAVTRATTLRFSTMGIISVGSLLLTGIVNTWFLSGTIPALVGTEYGRLLLIKVGLFGLMVSIAAANRLWFTPGLRDRPHGDDGATSIALRALHRNSLVEASLGLVILVIVGALGIVTPGEHTQPWWPFAFRLSTEGLRGRSDVPPEMVITGMLAVVGGGFLILGVVRQRLRTLSIVACLAFLLGAGGIAIRLLAVPAYPTSFFQSPISYTALSITAGAHLYADKCAACHGKGGRGDGPVVKDAKILPADLTTGYLLAQSDGDLFWWISHGRGNGSMPAFADALEENQRWDLINFLRAQASGNRTIRLSDLVTAAANVPAPDFAFESTRGQQETLRSLRGDDVVLLVFFTEPESQPRLEQLTRDQPYLERAGVRILAAPLSDSVGSEGPSDVRRSTPSFVIRVAPDVLQTYARFRPKSQLAESPSIRRHIEFLIDRAGYIRARWSPDEGSGWARVSDLLDQVWRLERLGTAQTPAGVHAH